MNLTYDWAPDAEAHAGSLVLGAEAHMEFVAGRNDLAPRAALVMEASVPHSSGPGAAQQALDELSAKAVAALSESLASRERLRRATHAELLSALSIGLREPSMRVWGLQVAADRDLREAASAAASSLESTDEHVRSAALSALVRFRDPATVPAITGGLDFNDYEELRAAIEAVHVIGGEEAVAFLEFVASGHSDPGMRLRAREALERMSARP